MTKTNPDDLKYMSNVSEAMLEQAPRGARLLLWAAALFVAIAIAWANWAELDEVTRGDGEIIPSKQLQVVQNLEGGIVSEIMVAEGDLVQKGQVLLRIDDTRFASSFQENKVRQMELVAKRARLKAEAESVEFEQPAEFPVEFLSMLDQERNLYHARKKELAANLAVLAQQLNQKKQELREAQAKEGQVGRSYGLLLKELKITKPLLNEGVISEVEYLRLRRQVNDLRGELEGIRISKPRIESTIAETETKLNEADLVFRSRARSELNEAEGEIARLTESLEGMQDRITRTEVKAPITGRVKQLLVNTIEGVIQPGDELLNIIPSEDKLLIEANIKPADIAQIAPGQRAVVKVSAYDFSIFGGVDAKVVFVSPSTVVNEEKETHYVVRLETDTPFLGGADKPLIAGMTVSVDIMTGKKTVMDYLLKPIFKAQDKALTER